MTTELFTVGDIITTTEENPTDGVQTGEKVEIIDIVMPDDTEDGVGFYCVENWRLSGYDIEFNNAKLLHSAKDGLHRLPTREELTTFLGNAVMDEYENIKIDSTQRDGDSLLIEGETVTGKRFLATVKITQITDANF